MGSWRLLLSLCLLGVFSTAWSLVSLSSLDVDGDKAELYVDKDAEEAPLGRYMKFPILRLKPDQKRTWEDAKDLAFRVLEKIHEAGIGAEISDIPDHDHFVIHTYSDVAKVADAALAVPDVYEVEYLQDAIRRPADKDVPYGTLYEKTYGKPFQRDTKKEQQGAAAAKAAKAKADADSAAGATPKATSAKFTLKNKLRNKGKFKESRLRERLARVRGGTEGAIGGDGSDGDDEYEDEEGGDDDSRAQLLEIKAEKQRLMQEEDSADRKARLELLKDRVKEIVMDKLAKSRGGATKLRELREKQRRYDEAGAGAHHSKGQAALERYKKLLRAKAAIESDPSAPKAPPAPKKIEVHLDEQGNVVAGARARVLSEEERKEKRRRLAETLDELHAGARKRTGPSDDEDNKAEAVEAAAAAAAAAISKEEAQEAAAPAAPAGPAGDAGDKDEL